MAYNDTPGANGSRLVASKFLVDCDGSGDGFWGFGLREQDGCNASIAEDDVEVGPDVGS